MLSYRAHSVCVCVCEKPHGDGGWGLSPIPVGPSPQLVGVVFAVTCVIGAALYF